MTYFIMRVLLLLGVYNAETAPSVVTITGLVDAAGGPAPNVWSTMTSWSTDPFNTPAPAHTSERYPFLKYIELFTATGGCYHGFPGCKEPRSRDLLNDPSQAGSGVNVSRLLLPLQNIVSAGFIPHIVTGNIPISMSDSPHLGTFGFNVAPPRNMSEYRAYISGVANALVKEFGQEEMAKWRWGVFTEYNNADWLKASAQSYFDTFDYTVCGLEDALGVANVDVGAHACVQCSNSADWDPLLFLHHVATGTSKCSGKKPHLNFTANSFYEHSPGDPGDLRAFKAQGLVVLDTAKKLGLDTGRFGIDEGRLLSGPEHTPAPLTTRAVGTGYQASWDAMFFKALAYSGSPGAYYSRWGVNAANNLFAKPESTVDNVAANVAQLAYKLAGGRLVTVTTNSTGPPAPSKLLCTGCDPAAYHPSTCQCGCHGARTTACCCPGGLPHPCIPCEGPDPTASKSIVDASVTVHKGAGTSTSGGTRTLRALLFHHHPHFSAPTEGVPAITAELALCGLKTAPKEAEVEAVGNGDANANATATATAKGTVTRAGESSANFWPLWWADQKAANLSHANGDYTTWSIYSDAPPLASTKAYAVFKARLGAYQAAAQLRPSNIEVVIGTDNCAHVKLQLPVHEVALVEIEL
jgi:hypothetical protein